MRIDWFAFANTRFAIAIAIVFAAASFLPLAAEAQDTLQSSPTVRVQAEPATPSGPVQSLEREALSIKTALGTFEFSVEIADEPEERTIGLMNRTSMPPRHGMLFDFGRTEQILMWMKNTYIPLDMIFIQPDGTVSHVAERTTPHSEAIVSSREPASHVLEVNAGIASLIGLKPGDRIVHRFFGTDG